MVTAQQILNARNALGESQAAFAERFGVHQTTIHRWETSGPREGGAARKAIELVLAGLSQRKSERRGARS